ncbi:uncharacterized protein Z518_10462 [Rhinocladiella mackenziei CBS 650.93]|uniref:Uncharacterized protein n=1 Tax=Rhinocladiella mackenziei CBS 650.93 TaxID=1442369 RepID=A0A0D2GPN5_9EURO|nr:uncharacterized protein Z518_10462 [Rhinocladiella mackenziei CBS 650.93]KIX00323.1 hypothetical protein Z518_10462 [Rhinocladiella mackenziei CBS 650.93]
MAGNGEAVVPETVSGPATADDGSTSAQSVRAISVYDAVAGRAGLNGFLTKDQIHVLPLAPEDFLLRRTTLPEDLVYRSYDAAGELSGNDRLPESEMVKAIHSYASDFYSSATVDKGMYDFRSLDETALLAMGILLEEAVKEALGEGGDMALVEPEGLERGLGESKMTRHQVKGRVKPMTRSKDLPDEHNVDPDESPVKKTRR